ncbi:MAG TPA: mechanosensitive ion channel domain-containing protein [Gaiellaceae bacterium]|nr:mechanosensitive ion channel domain-containing protein [Gaiellaceae bacterium]
MAPLWKHLIVAAAIFVAISLLERLVDWRLRHRPLPPEAITRYRVLRRTVSAVILVVGLLSALLAIPEVRSVAGGLLASSALLGIVVGFAAQRTLGNFVAGVMIALSQPVRIGDRVVYGGEQGVVEEIGLSYTFIRTADRARLVVPNEKLASDTIRNASIRNRETFAEITVPLPLSTDLGAAIEGLREELDSERQPDVFVSSLDGSAVVTLRAAAADENAADRLAADLRVRAHRRLRALGVWG